MDPFSLRIEDSIDRSIAPYVLKNGFWEPLQTELITRLVTRGQQVVDAGAHVGYFSVLMSRLVGLEGTVHAFEPEPGNYELLKTNLDRNRADNARANQYALADRSGEEALYLSRDNAGDHRLSPVSGRTACRVEIHTLDSYVAHRAVPVDFIKLDVQGAESRVLSGMAGLVEDNRQRLICLVEFDPRLLPGSNGGVTGFARRLARLNARVSWVELEKRTIRLTELRDALALRSLARRLRLKGEDGCLMLTFSAMRHDAVLRRLAA